MRTIFIMTWANIKSKKLQCFALMMVFIAVSILFFLSLKLFQTTGDYSELYVESKTSQSIIIVDSPSTKDIIEEYLKDNPKIEHYNILSNYDEVLETNLKNDTSSVPIVNAFFTECANGEYDQIRIVEGKSPKELELNEVIFSYGKSKLNDVQVGDVIVVSTETGSTEMVVAGIGVDLSFNFDTITLNRFWTTLETIEQLDPELTSFSVGITYNEYTDSNEKEILKELEEVLGDNASETFVISHSLLLQANSFFQIIMGAIFTLIGVILIVVALFIIRSIVYNSIITDSKKIATLKSSGFSKNNIISMYLIEYGIIAFISIIIGMFSSILLGQVVLSDINELSNLFGVSNHLNVSSSIIVLMFVLVVIEGTVYLVARGVSSIKPALAISRGEHVSDATAVFSAVKHQKLPLTMVIAIKDIIYNKKMILTVFLFTIAVSFTIITLSSSSHSFTMQKDNMKLWLGYDVDAKIVHSDPLDLTTYNDLIDTLEDSEMVNDSITVYTDFNSQVYDEYEEQYITSLSQVFLIGDDSNIEFSLLRGRLPENESEIILAENLFIYLDKSLGDYVRIRSFGEEKELLVVGTTQGMTNQGMTFSLFVDELDVDQLNNSLIQLSFNEGYSETELESEIESLLSPNMSMLFEEANTSMLSMFDILDVVTSGIIGIFSVIALIVLLNLNLTYVYKERYNYSVYKSIGMNNRQIINIYLYKNMLINIVGVFVGAVIAFVLTPIIMDQITGTLGINEFPSTMNYISIGLAFSIVTLVTLFNSLIIKRTITNITPKELLVE